MTIRFSNVKHRQIRFGDRADSEGQRIKELRAAEVARFAAGAGDRPQEKGASWVSRVGKRVARYFGITGIQWK